MMQTLLHEGRTLCHVAAWLWLGTTMLDDFCGTHQLWGVLHGPSLVQLPTAAASLGGN
jgi:hypothetical protein